MDDKFKKNLQPYEKPRLRAIELSAEEVLGVGCKTVSGGASHMASGCLAFNCFANGS
jgi:hypothetical protein